MAKIVSVVVLECVGEAHKTGKDKQGAVGGEGNKGRGRDSLYICGEEQHKLHTQTRRCKYNYIRTYISSI